ncbi:hypothetical protein [Allokutzneria albata]|uniref:Uncharacterized protein n=1 Tax=Allokutzneria albata TaxID=211114 RepID=A0A1H0AJR7_ALLAB|nr:hypothetical protein [Allokutzneria albata]SDN33818.1 hypothetical protein SAMN04489726_6128 [Allokutzneria albata]
MRSDLAEPLSVMSRRRRSRHGPLAHALETMLGRDERIRAVTAGLSPGIGDVLLAATTKRLVAVARGGWAISVFYPQIASVVTGGWLGLTVTIHTAGTVLSFRAPGHSGREFADAVRIGTPIVSGGLAAV